MTYATRVSSASSSVSASATSWTRIVASGASPIVPTTSSWPSWPISSTVYPAAAYRFACTCTFVTSGQVASITSCSSVRECSCTEGATPCAEYTTVAPRGTSVSSSTKIAPRASRSRTTWMLWTICLRTYTGAP